MDKLQNEKCNGNASLYSTGYAADTVEMCSIAFTLTDRKVSCPLLQLSLQADCFHPNVNQLADKSSPFLHSAASSVQDMET
eukprot:6210133-Pleurochrysis_carterae.AAC.1